MQELFDNIGAQLELFTINAKENITKGNKAAGVRARKASIELEKLFKEYRKQSVKAQ